MESRDCAACEGRVILVKVVLVVGLVGALGASFWSGSLRRVEGAVLVEVVRVCWGVGLLEEMVVLGGGRGLPLLCAVQRVHCCRSSHPAR